MSTMEGRKRQWFYIQPEIRDLNFDDSDRQSDRNGRSREIRKRNYFPFAIGKRKKTVKTEEERNQKKKG